MRPWFSGHCHSTFSTLDGISKPEQIIETSIRNGLSGSAITDHGVLAGTISYLKAKKPLIEKYSKKPEDAEFLQKVKDFKQVLGCELYISEEDSKVKSKENGKLSHLVVLAKNLDGWRSLIQLTSEANREEHFYRKSRLSLDELAPYTGNLITFSGHMGSALANAVFSDISLAYSARTYEEAKSFVDPEWKRKCFDLVAKYQEIFGRENFFIEIQRIDEENLPAAKIAASALRFIAEKSNCQKVGTCDSHYPTRASVEDQRVVLCTMMKTTMREVMQSIKREDSEIGLGGFFRSNNYHIPSLDEINQLHTEDELENSIKIMEMCENYNVFSPPSFPEFNCPNGLKSEEYLRQLCRKGFKNKIRGRVQDENQYVERIKEELGVFTSYKLLSDYFLVVADYVNAARERGETIGGGRGSASGSLTSFLLEINAVDPILYDLSFARFFNAGRIKDGKVDLPDIDVDFEPTKRYLTQDYIRDKYGRDKTAQMATFERLMGKSALKEVLRVNEACSADEMNRITEWIEDEAKISDELQKMVENDEIPSIIMWSLENEEKGLKEWAYLTPDGKIEGKFARYFEQAIRLEKNIKATSKHASAIAIADFRLSDRIPMIRDKSSDELIVGVPMNDLADMGVPKLDVLGLSCLSKVRGVSNLLLTGDF